jgi:hypothetical protein
MGDTGLPLLRNGFTDSASQRAILHDHYKVMPPAPAAVHRPCSCGITDMLNTAYRAGLDTAAVGPGTGLNADFTDKVSQCLLAMKSREGSRP